VSLPSEFAPTHPTAGLPGYPAIDVFGAPGAQVVVEFWGWVRKVSGKPPAAGGQPGGPYGRSVYLLNRVNGVERFLTHLDRLDLAVGQHVRPGQIIGTVADSAVSGKPGTSHVHMGRRASVNEVANLRSVGNVQGSVTDARRAGG
jgi:murein DD-endopeptidase MepM/ murein hydrolase activator NlpD